MRSSTWRLEDLRNVILNLGFVGENLHTRQIFDCKKIFDQYPNASVSMTVTPPEGEPYPGTIERDGDLVIWDVRDSDLVAEGDGEIQLVFTQEPHIARSYNAGTHICRSQVPTGSIPSGLDDYITRADQLLDQVEDTFPAGGTTGQVLAKKSDTDYDTEWVDQGGGTEDYDELENRPQIGGVTLTGNKTLHDLGAASEADVEAKYTKPETGIPASDLAAGVIPDPEDLIDDNAGAGDTDKVWSADKSHELLTEITNTQEDVSDLQKDKAPVIIDHAEGNPIVLTDGADGLPVEGMKIHFLPVQDLHGQSAPYPPGGGKNLFDQDDTDYINKSVESYGQSDEKAIAQINNLPAGTYTLSFKAKVTSLNGAQAVDTRVGIYFRAVNNGTQFNVNGQISGIPTVGAEVTKSVTFTLTDDYVGKFQYCYVYTGKNNSVSPEVNYTGVVYDVQIEAGNTVSPFAPYSNICPITGWQGLTVWRTGKNLLDITDVEFEGYYNTSGDKSLSSSYNCYLVSVKPETTYTISGNFAGIITYWDSLLNFISGTNQGSGASKTFTTPSNCAYIRRSILKTNIDGTQMLELGSSVSPYVPYTGQSYPVTFPEIIYGGTPDVVNGVLKVEWAKFVATSSAIRRNDGNRWYIPNTYTNSIIPQADTADAVISNVFKSATGGQYDDKCFINSSGAIRFNTSTEYESIDALVSAIPGMEFVFLLATPYEIPLSDIPVPVTLIGDNTIWSDANGTIELDYRADTKLWISGHSTTVDSALSDTSENPVQNKVIKTALDGKEPLHNTTTVSGATPTITGVENTRYICGECAILSITAPASGCIDVVFESGSTPTVLTVSSAKTGVTAIKWANGFDPTALEANTTYEINILDGEFGVVGSWT